MIIYLSMNTLVKVNLNCITIGFKHFKNFLNEILHAHVVNLIENGSLT